MIQQLIVGMPASGKSTFIAALRHLLLANEVHTELELAGLADVEAHVNRLEEEWLACQQVERTKPATEGWVQFRVRDRSTLIEATLSIPDLRGEAYEQPAASGQCLKDLYQALADADGILLFTNADREDDALMIDEFADILGTGEASLLTDVEPFRPEEMPEEVKIVEFLQVANRRPLRPRTRKIAVAVSAWDILAGREGLMPEKWLAKYRPMLAQFLDTNAELWEYRVYGISAQGGRLPQDKDALERIRRPSERIQVAGHGAGAHDLTAPLRWLMVTE